MVVVKAAKGQRVYLQVVAAPYGIQGSGEFDATTEMSLEAGVGERCWEPGDQEAGEVPSLVAAIRAPSGQARAWLEGNQLF